MAANFYWIRPVASQTIPSNAVFAGVTEKGDNIYVGRAFHGGNILPGKVISNQNVCYVGYDSLEYAKHEYEILCADHYSWVPSKDGFVPPNAVLAGRNSADEAMYVGRTTKDAPIKACGKVHCRLGRLYVPYYGKEEYFTEYEVLV